MITIDEEKALRNEIETLNNNINRKDNIIYELYSIIYNTKDINLIAEAGVVMRKINMESK